MKTITIECVVKEVHIDAGLGNKLILFKGNKVSIRPVKNEKHRYPVLDSSGTVFGSITPTAVRRVTGKNIEVVLGENA